MARRKSRKNLGNKEQVTALDLLAAGELSAPANAKLTTNAKTGKEMVTPHYFISKDTFLILRMLAQVGMVEAGENKAPCRDDDLIQWLVITAKGRLISKKICNPNATAEEREKVFQEWMKKSEEMSKAELAKKRARIAAKEAEQKQAENRAENTQAALKVDLDKKADSPQAEAIKINREVKASFTRFKASISGKPEQDQKAEYDKARAEILAICGDTAYFKQCDTLLKITLEEAKK